MKVLVKAKEPLPFWIIALVALALVLAAVAFGVGLIYSGLGGS